MVFSAANGQVLSDSVFILPDTAKPFTLENFYQIILEHHPIAKQAALLPEVARQEIRLARGAFDPELEANYLMKRYKDVEYYRLFDGNIKVPTRSPIIPTVGVQRNSGDHLNRQNYISDQYDFREVYAGFNIPLGRGLITDERRTALRQARLFADMVNADQIRVINTLLLDAANDYWDWYYSYYNFRLALNTASVAGEIFRRTKETFQGGEVAPIDTVQSKITFQERLVNRQEAFTEWKNNTIKISTYLWDSLMNPLELSPQYVPVNETELIVLPETSLEELVGHARLNHPDLRTLNLKLDQLEYDRRLAVEFLKPRLNIFYYMLNQPFHPKGFNGEVTFDDNYRLGLDVSIPLFLRKERAKLAQTRLNLAATRYDRDLARREIVNEVNSAYNQLVNNGLILQQQQAMVANYHRVLSAELLNLQEGESDLFKINVQQERLFNSESKLIKIIAEYEKQKAVLYWSAGVRPLP